MAVISMRTTTPDKYDDNKSKHSIALIIPEQLASKQTNMQTFFPIEKFSLLTPTLAHFVSMYQIAIQ